MTDHLLVRVAKWPGRQTIGFLENVVGVVKELKPTDVVPPAVSETFAWLKVQVPRAFGLGTPAEQMSSSVVLGIAAIFTSIFTGGVTIFFVTLFMLTFLAGALRLWPFVNRLWPLSSAGGR